MWSSTSSFSAKNNPSWMDFLEPLQNKIYHFNKGWFYTNYLHYFNALGYHIVTGDDFYNFFKNLLRGSKYQYLQYHTVSKR